VVHVVRVELEVVFQALADATRLRILRVLAATGEESCLCELVDSLGEPKYAVSRHLRVLRQAGLVTAEREGRFVYHRLVSTPAYLAILVELIRAVPDSHGKYRADLTRFRARIRAREAGRCRTGLGGEKVRATG
jgi:ArsR family transcriptional regulator